MSNTLKWVWLAEKCGAGNPELLKLIENFDNIDEIFAADYDAYLESGISERLCEDLCDKNTDKVVKILGYCQTAQVGILAYDSERYPVSLRSLKNPPAVLYYVGELPDLNRSLCISVVGTRTMSEYGMKAAYKIAYEVAAAGAVVVSGMALGIDGIASCAAIAAGGVTVAVMGCGIDIVYPKSHKTLWDNIKRHGAVISEFPPTTEPRGMNFPIRNRIISGLGQGTVVVDADVNSGAMITAKNAILQGRDLYAVPANIGAENSSGTNSLIRDGAQAVLCGNDIIRNYMYIYRDRLNSAKIMNSEKYSEFNEKVVERMGICAKISSAAKAKGEDTTDSPKNEKNFKNKDNGERSTPKAIENKPVAKHYLKSEAVPSMKDSLTDTSSTRDSAGDRSAEILEKLSEKQRKIFEEMPLDRAVTVDYLTKSGFALGEVISALTVLEIKGLVSSLPGALYIRK